MKKICICILWVNKPQILNITQPMGSNNFGPSSCLNASIDLIAAGSKWCRPITVIAPARARSHRSCLLPLPFLSRGVKEGGHICFFSPGTQLIGLPSAPISLALMDSQSAVVAPHSSFGLRCISSSVGWVLPVPVLHILSSADFILLSTRYNDCTVLHISSNFGLILC